MRRQMLAIAVVVFAAVGCGGRQASPPSSTPPTASKGTEPVATGESLSSYPGAKQTSSSSFSGTGPTGTSGQWTTVTLETTDPFEKVRDFYKANAPKGYAQSFTTEQSTEGGRSYTVWFARADGRAWHTIVVKEEKAERKVTIALASGSAP